MIRRLLPGREAGWLLLLAAALPLALLGATLSGPAPIAWHDAWRIVLGVSGGAAIDADVYQRIIWSLRMPRALLAALAGAGLALAGTVPVADPQPAGRSLGAGHLLRRRRGAVTVLVLGLGGGLLSVSGGAFIGALGAFALVMLLAGRSLQGESTLFILAGVAVTQLLSALTSLITLWQADANATRGVMFWLLGSFSDARWPQVGLCGLALAGGAAAVLAAGG
ncbi:iron ABC transporter permease [Serratia marcescens]|nr:iron ABC transporter permease [Serratia marcescens]